MKYKEKLNEITNKNVQTGASSLYENNNLQFEAAVCKFKIILFDLL